MKMSDMSNLSKLIAEIENRMADELSKDLLYARL